MKFAIVFLLALASASSFADQFQTVSLKKEYKGYAIDVSYPEFFSNSIPAYRQINALIYQIIVTEGGCGIEDNEEAQIAYDYYGRGRVIALNSRYVGVEVFASDYCGGAHPNHYTYFLTFDSNNGKYLDIYRELGFKRWDERDYDWEKQRERRRELSSLIVDLIPQEAKECMLATTRDERIEELTDTFYPYPAGLAKGKTIVISTSVPHAMKPCEFSLRLSYEQLKALITPGSFLEEWLQ